MKYILMAICILLTGLASFYYFKPAEKYTVLQPVITEINNEKLVPVYIDRVVEKEIIKEVEIPITEYIGIYRSLRHFQDKAELQLFLDSIPEVIYLESGTEFTSVDCDDLAYTLQEQAAEAGYFLSVEYVIKGYQAHLENTARVNNEIYFIEPITHEITNIVELD